MKIVKKILSVLLCVLLPAALLNGCGTAPAKTDGKLSVVTTIFPVYDWVRQILGERSGGVELTLLLDDGVDLHSYQPTADDMVKISACDLFICVGGESDAWVEPALAEAVNRNMTVLKLLDLLGDSAKVEETVEGMEHGHEHEHEEDHEHGEDAEHHAGEDEAEYDEHVWLSLRNAAALCGQIAAALGRLDPAGADTYAANSAAYLDKLRSLDAQFAAAVSAARTDTLLFGDRFPFRYLTDDYGLHYYAAFSGCSAETEASFETIIFLSGKVDALGLGAVLTIDGSDGKIARTIVENTGAKSAKILQMDSMQSATLGDAERGATYLGGMERNLEVLKEALN